MLIILFICFVCVGDNLVNSQEITFSGNCRLDPDPSVEYRCTVTGAVEGTRACLALEPTGTIVQPRCRRPNYYAVFPLNFMKCIDGYWNYVARCSPECGRVTPDGKGLVVGGRLVKRGQLPWHAGIYSKATQPYVQICGGSLINNNVVISAAHCFWSDLDQQKPASQFAVAVGKLYRPWDDPIDEAQKSDVKGIHLPTRFQGAFAHFQDDIALVEVADAFRFNHYIRPVCLSFDFLFEKQQLNMGNMGKVAGWGLTDANGKPSPVLLTVDLPFVEVGTCIKDSPPDYREYITSDKICAGTLDSGSSLCQGDSGGGLAFPDLFRGIERYYLRGVVSTAANSEDACNTDTYTSFTSINMHENFIKTILSEITPADTNYFAGGPSFLPSFLPSSQITTNTRNPQEQCGLVTLNHPQTLVVDEKSTMEGQWPWHIALYQLQTNSSKYICGGTLVSHRHVLTAAHCVNRKNKQLPVINNTLSVYLGKNTLRLLTDNVQIRVVHRIVTHPDYNGTSFSRDISILRMREPVTYSHWVRPACLWPDNQVDLNNVIGKRGSVVGWSFDETGVPAEDLSLVEMPVVSQETCIKSYSDFYVRFTSTYTYCAGFRNETLTCNGDSGGGMVFKIGSAWYIRGLVSLSIARPKGYQCDPKYYVIFTDLAKFLPWIRENISDY